MSEAKKNPNKSAVSALPPKQPPAGTVKTWTLKEFADRQTPAHAARCLGCTTSAVLIALKQQRAITVYEGEDGWCHAEQMVPFPNRTEPTVERVRANLIRD